MLKETARAMLKNTGHEEITLSSLSSSCLLYTSIEERAAKAADLKAAGACNCSQAVVKVFEDKLSLDDETLMKLTAGYAAGMGCLEATCGALIGACLLYTSRCV